MEIQHADRGPDAEGGGRLSGTSPNGSNARSCCRMSLNACRMRLPYVASMYMLHAVTWTASELYELHDDRTAQISNHRVRESSKLSCEGELDRAGVHFQVVIAARIRPVLIQRCRNALTRTGNVGEGLAWTHGG